MPESQVASIGALTENQEARPVVTEAGSEIVRRLPFYQLVLSPTNPRRSADAKADAELTQSIKEKDVLEPLLVRSANDGKFEVVVGYRRFNCARKAGKDDLPCIVREMTDDEAREIQIIENLQRKDVSPLEEAFGLKALQEGSTPIGSKTTGKPSTIEQIAKKIGKSASYVYQRLKLCELIPDAQKEMESGRLPAAHAIVMARLPESGQKIALQQCFPKYDKEATEPALSVRSLVDQLRYEAMIDLNAAPFDLKNSALNPAAGACTACSKMSANRVDLKDLGDHTCTDKECYQNKVQTFVSIRVADVRAKGKNLFQVVEEYRTDTKKLDTDKLYYGEFQSIYDDKRKCKFAQDAIIASGSDAGKIITVCATKTCSQHFPQQARRDPATAKKAEEIRTRERAVWLRALSMAIEAALKKISSLEQANVLRWLASQQAAEYLWKDKEIWRSLTIASPQFSSLRGSIQKINKAPKEHQTRIVCLGGMLREQMIYGAQWPQWSDGDLFKALGIKLAHYKKPAVLALKMEETEHRKPASVPPPEATPKIAKKKAAKTKKPARKKR